MLKEILENASKTIPSMWPLQHWLATNPLSELNEHAITELPKILARFDVATTLCLADYKAYYHGAKIKPDTLQRAVDEYLQKQASLSQDTTAARLLHELARHVIVNFLMSFEDKLEYEGQKPQTANLLVAKQLQVASYDDLLGLVQQKCLDFFMFYAEQANKTKAQTKELSLFAVWREHMRARSRYWQQFVEANPDETEAFILAQKQALKIPDALWPDYLAQLLWQVKGWAGYAKWLQQHHDHPYAFFNISLQDIVALWLAYEVELHAQYAEQALEYKALINIDKDAADYQQHRWQVHLDAIADELSAEQHEFINIIKQQIHLDKAQMLWIWQRALELSYQQPLLEDIKAEQQYLSDTEAATDKASMQWVFCIDVRSEPMRRQLEMYPEVETLSCAGFFAAEHELVDTAAHKNAHQCPIILSPNGKVSYAPAISLWQKLKYQVKAAVGQVKQSLLSAFALVETLGIFYGIYLLLKNYLAKYLPQEQAKQLADFNIDVPLARQVDIAKNFLASISLLTSENFADLIVVCAHEAKTTNNPFDSGLQCGACGGNHGGANAILAVHCLQNPAVRSELAKANINIPETTTFLAACHNTTADSFTYYEESHYNEATQTHIARAKDIGKRAGDAACKRREARLPGKKHALTRAHDWAELIPEMGLANNAAIIIAPRPYTKNLNLRARAFLHTYDHEQDADGSILAAIMGGPLLVAHLINMQYYFSRVSPEVYGSGNKTIHNLLPWGAVMLGNQSDLQWGLPRQSVFFREYSLHEPLRLAAYIAAPQAMIDKIVAENAELAKLVKGEWLYIYSL